MSSKRWWLACGLLMTTLLAGCGADTSATRHATAAPTATATATATPPPKPTTLYLGQGQTVYALDIATGTKRWTYTTGQPDVPDGMTSALSAITSANGKVYFVGKSSANWTLYAVSADTGAPAWKNDIAQDMGAADNLVATPDAIILSSTSFGEIVSHTTLAVDPNTGKTLWMQSKARSTCSLTAPCSSNRR